MGRIMEEQSSCFSVSYRLMGSEHKNISKINGAIKGVRSDFEQESTEGIVDLERQSMCANTEHLRGGGILCKIYVSIQASFHMYIR